MNTIQVLTVLIGFFLFSGLYDSTELFAFIRIDMLNEDDQTEADISRLMSDLQRITGLMLHVEKGYVRVQPDSLKDQNTPSSETARVLFLDALRSTNVYKIRIDRGANLGRVLKGDLIELDFLDQKYLRFRGVPPEVFNTSMIFFHELVHRHLALPDPTIDEIRLNRNARGKTVEYMNRIERELHLPERLHYFPRKNPVPGSNGFCIYFGTEGKRIEIDAEIFRPLIQKGKNAGYAGLLRN
ncbi:MAG TPA: hypothetical protein VLH08_16230 [Acidobacteriota bacterium]|nr:hypothetical protein [Acidobacteriota bacterium]